MLEANKNTAKNFKQKTIYSDKPNGAALLLVMVFYMGIDDGGTKVETTTQ